MRLRWGPRRRSARLLSPGGGGPDLISDLPDDLLLLVLARLPCAGAAARTGVLSRRWRGLWARLRQIVLSDVVLRSLGAALGRIPGPPPAVSILDICLPNEQLPWRIRKEHLPDAASVNSLFRAAARLEPEEFVFELPSGLIDGPLAVDLPCFHRAISIVLNLYSVFLHVPAGVKFPALEALCLSCCTANIGRFVSRCPRLRTLRLSDISFYAFDLTVNSASLQELVLDGHSGWIDRVNIVAPELKQLTMSFRTRKVTLHTAGRQGQLPSLHINACASSSIFQGEVDTFTQEIEKHMIAEFSVLELHLATKGHVFGALAFHLLGMNRICSAMQRLNVVLQKTTVKEKCPFDCPCEIPNWRSHTISLTALEEVEINGFDGDEHEIDFLKLIFKCAPMLRRIIVRLSHEASASNDGCTEIYNIFRSCSSMELSVYLSSGLMVDRQNCPST